MRRAVRYGRCQLNRKAFLFPEGPTLSYAAIAPWLAQPSGKTTSPDPTLANFLAGVFAFRSPAPRPPAAGAKSRWRAGWPGCRTQLPPSAARSGQPVCLPVTAVLVIRGGRRLCAAIRQWETEGAGQSASAFCPRSSLDLASAASCAALVELCRRLEIHASRSACVYRTARDSFRNTGPQPVTRILLR
jgi:hypothetical protein